MTPPRARAVPALVGLALLTVGSAGLRAGVESVGTTSANFLKIPYAAGPVGMGEAFTAVSNDESALDYNPAGLARSLQSQVSASQIQWFQGINLGHLGGITPLGSLGGAGLGITWLDAGSLVATQRVANGSNPLANYVQTGTFTPYDLELQGAWAWQPAPHWDVGVGGQVIEEVVGASAGWGEGLDLGAQRTDAWGWLDLGAAVRNLGSSIALGSAAGQPLTFQAGMAGHFFGRRLWLSTDLDVPVDNGPIPSLGLEWWVAQPLAVRAGWIGGYMSQPTAGLGFRYSIFLLDYAYEPYSQLGATHRVTVSVDFGGPTARVRALRPLLGPLGEASWREGGFRLLPQRPEAVESWTLTLLSADGAAERVWQGQGPPPPRVVWRGRDGQGQVLPDGLYRVRLEADYRGGLRATALSRPVELDSTPPTVALALRPLVIRPATGKAVLVPTHLGLRATDKNGIGGWKIELRDSHGGLFRAFGGDGPPPKDLVWRGTDGKGRTVDSGSTYIFRPFAKDRLGNWAQGPPQALIVLMRELRYDLSSDALFKPGKADVRISAYDQLFALKRMIEGARQPGTSVDVVGYTDDTPVVHSVYKDNAHLSLARAQAVVKFLVTLLGMDPARIHAVGRGEADPKADNRTPKGRLANRRVEVVIHAREFR